MDLRAVIFMPALAGAVIFGFVFVLYISNYYLTVLEGTATGAKEVTWFSEPILDNFWKLWYMLWLFGLWLGPGYLLARFATAGADSSWLRSVAAGRDHLAALSSQSTLIALCQYDLAAADAGRIRRGSPRNQRSSSASTRFRSRCSRSRPLPSSGRS